MAGLDNNILGFNILIVKMKFWFKIITVKLELRMSIFIVFALMCNPKVHVMQLFLYSVQ